jgi:hypothetical protein
VLGELGSDAIKARCQRTGGLARTRTVSHRRGPPRATALRGRHAVGVETTRDLSEALPTRALVVGASGDLRRYRDPAARTQRRTAFGWHLSPSLFEHPLELVDGDQLRAPRHLDRLDERQDASDERRAADAERLGGLRAV